MKQFWMSESKESMTSLLHSEALLMGTFAESMIIPTCLGIHSAINLFAWTRWRIGDLHIKEFSRHFW